MNDKKKKCYSFPTTTAQWPYLASGNVPGWITRMNFPISVKQKQFQSFFFLKKKNTKWIFIKFLEKRSTFVGSSKNKHGIFVHYCSVTPSLLFERTSTKKRKKKWSCILWKWLNWDLVVQTMCLKLNLTSKNPYLDCCLAHPTYTKHLYKEHKKADIEVRE